MKMVALFCFDIIFRFRHGWHQCAQPHPSCGHLLQRRIAVRRHRRMTWLNVLPVLKNNRTFK